MKKIITFLSVLLFPIFIFAKEYEVKDMNIKLEVNDNYIVLTKENLDNNEGLSKLNISKDALKELMDKNKIYFDIIKDDVSYEILVIVPDNKLEDWNNFSNATDKLLTDMKTLFAKKVGAEISDVYKTKHNFIVVDYYDSKTGYYIVNYYTVVNARGYNIQLQKTSAITDEERNELKEIVNSVDITVLDEYKNESKETQERINNYGKTKSSFNYNNILYGALIGACAGLISYIASVIIKKKKSSV